jgi:hypothetical protein
VSAVTFATGAALPLGVSGLLPETAILVGVTLATLVALVVLGGCGDACHGGGRVGVRHRLVMRLFRPMGRFRPLCGPTLWFQTGNGGGADATPSLPILQRRLPCLTMNTSSQPFWTN